MKQKDFGVLLDDLLLDKEISADKLGKDLAISGETIRNYIKGKTLPDADALRKIVNYFGVSADYLLGIDGCSKTPKDDYKTLCKELGLTDKSTLTLYKAALFSRLTKDELAARLAERMEKRKNGEPIKKPVFYNRITECLNLLLSDFFGEIGCHILCEIADYVTRGKDNESLLYANVIEIDGKFDFAWDTQPIELVKLDTLLSGHLLNIQHRLIELRSAYQSKKRLI